MEYNNDHNTCDYLWIFIKSASLNDNNWHTKLFLLKNFFHILKFVNEWKKNSVYVYFNKLKKNITIIWSAFENVKNEIIVTKKFSLRYRNIIDSSIDSHNSTIQSRSFMKII